MTRRSLRQNFSSALSGQLAYAASQFAMLSILSHTTDVATVGIYALALAVTAPVFIICEMRLRLVQSTDSEEAYTFSAYFGHRLIAIALPVAGVLLFGWASNSWLEQEFLILAGVTTYKAVESLLDITYGMMGRAERLDFTARSLLARSVGNVVIFAAIVVPTSRVDLAYFALSGYLLACLWASLRVVEKLGHSPRPVWSRTNFRELTRLGFPLGLSFAVGSITVNIPRYFLQWEWGAEALGIFATAAYVLTAVTTIVNSLAHATTPRLARHFGQRDFIGFRVLLRRTLVLGAVFGAVGLVGTVSLGPAFLRIAFGPEFVEGSSALILLMAAGCFQYGVTFMRDAFAAMRFYRIALPISISNGLTVLAACSVLIPAYGVTGAAASILAGQVLAFALYVFSMRIYGKRTLT